MKNEKKGGLDLNDGCVSTIGAILLWLLIPTIVASAIIAIIKAIVS